MLIPASILEVKKPEVLCWFVYKNLANARMADRFAPNFIAIAQCWPIPSHKTRKCGAP